MRVVLDTNILLSALISPHGAPDAIYRAWRAGRFNLVTSAVQLNELRRASRYPKLRSILQPHLVGAMVNHLNRTTLIDPLLKLPDGIAVDDPHDAFLVAMALASEADYLVTGDRRAGLLEQGSIGRTRILAPSGFHAEVL
jgi:uncharacterized protein